MRVARRGLDMAGLRFSIRTDDDTSKRMARVRQRDTAVEELVRNGNRWLFYYGGADKYVGVASAAVR